MKPNFRGRPSPWIVLTLGIVCIALLGWASHKKSQNASDAAIAADLKAATVSDNPKVHLVAAANTGFCFSLLTALSKDQSHQNIFFSPFSISQALTLALNGAGGNTQRDISKVLHVNGIPMADIDEANHLLMTSLQDPDPQVTLSVGNALWADRTSTFKPDYQLLCQRFYDARATSLDFSSPSATGTINDWVRQQTQGKIDNIVKPGDLTQASFVLTNAIYFHGQWSKQFDKHSTMDGPFLLEDGTKKVLPFMARTGYYSYSQSDQFEAIRMPYGGGRIALYIFLPRSPNNLDAFLKTITSTKWDAWLPEMIQTRLSLFLPRFQVSQNLTLNDALGYLGMASSFKPDADFTPMGMPKGCISKVAHSAVLEVNEEGTIAAAVTGDRQARSLTLSPIPIHVDHPFFMAIRDDATGTILFAGAIRNPR